MRLSGAANRIAVVLAVIVLGRFSLFDEAGGRRHGGPYRMPHISAIVRNTEADQRLRVGLV
jgi:hypothetical protein